MDPRAASSAGQPAPTRRFYPTHPLFPLPSGERETKEIHTITFDRWDHQGRKERCPLRLPASEIRSFGDIVDMFGGGTYAFVAYDSKGRVARRTTYADRVHLNIPCKPLDPTAPKADARRRERAAEPAAPTAAPVAPKAPQTPEEAAKAKLPFDLSTDPQLALMQIMIHQTNAAEERALKFGLMVDRLLAQYAVQQSAQPATGQASSAAMMEAIAALFAAMPQPASPTMDPTFVLAALTMLAEKARPADPMAELERLVPVFLKVRDIMNRRRRSKETTRLHPDITEHNHGGSSMSNQSPKAPTDPALVWVEIPEVGWVQMAPETAAAYFAHYKPQNTQSATPAPTTKPTEPSASPAFWDDVLARLLDPAEQLACAQAVERRSARKKNPALMPQERGFWDEIVERLAHPSNQAAFNDAYERLRKRRAQTSTAPTHEHKAASSVPTPEHATDASASPAFWDDVIARMRDPNEFEACKRALERKIATQEDPASNPPLAPHARGFWDDIADRLAIPSERAAFQEAGARAARAQTSTTPTHEHDHQEQHTATASPSQPAMTQPQSTTAPAEAPQRASTAAQPLLPLPRERDGSLAFTEFTFEQMEFVLADAEEVQKLPPGAADAMRTMIAEDRAARAIRAQRSAANASHVAATSPPSKASTEEPRASSPAQPPHSANAAPSENRSANRATESPRAPLTTTRAALPLPRERDGSLAFMELTIQQMEIVLADAEEVQKLPPGAADVMREMVAQAHAMRAKLARKDAAPAPSVVAAAAPPTKSPPEPSAAPTASTAPRGFWDEVVMRLTFHSEREAWRQAMERKLAMLDDPPSMPPLAPEERGFWDEVAERLTDPREEAACRAAFARTGPPLHAQTSPHPEGGAISFMDLTIGEMEVILTDPRVCRALPAGVVEDMRALTREAQEERAKLN